MPLFIVQALRGAYGQDRRHGLFVDKDDQKAMARVCQGLFDFVRPDHKFELRLDPDAKLYGGVFFGRNPFTLKLDGGKVVMQSIADELAEIGGTRP
eukprot:6991632-Pyramimonas_sp.AAC.1